MATDTNRLPANLPSTVFTAIQKGDWQVALSDKAVLDALKAQVAAGATESQFAAFLWNCKQYDLNPFNQEIWWLPIQGGKVRMARDGYRRIANRHKEFDGEETLWKYKGDDKWYADPQTGKELEGAKVLIHRKDRRFASSGVALWSEYGRTGNDAPAWRYKHTMLETRAYCIAAKKAFEITGIVDEDEAAIIQEPPETQYDDGKTSIQKIADQAAKLAKSKEIIVEQKPEPPLDIPDDNAYNSGVMKEEIGANLKAIGATSAIAKTAFQSLSDGKEDKLMGIVKDESLAKTVLERSKMLKAVKDYCTSKGYEEADVMGDLSIRKADSLIGYLKLGKDDTEYNKWERLEQWLSENTPPTEEEL